MQEAAQSMRSDLYMLLEEEKIPRELWPYILAFMTRSMKLTYFDDRDTEYMTWKIIAQATRIQMVVDNLVPPPEYFPSLEDYRRYVESMMMIPRNLEAFMLAVLKRSYHGFERSLEASRYFYMGAPQRR